MSLEKIDALLKKLSEAVSTEVRDEHVPAALRDPSVPKEPHDALRAKGFKWKSTGAGKDTGLTSFYVHPDGRKARLTQRRGKEDELAITHDEAADDKLSELLRRLKEDGDAGSKPSSMEAVGDSGHGKDYDAARAAAYDALRSTVKNDYRTSDENIIDHLEAFSKFKYGHFDRGASTVEMLEKLSNEMRKELDHPVKVITSLKVGSDLRDGDLYLAHGSAQEIEVILMFLISLKDTIKEIEAEDVPEPDYPDFDPTGQDDPDPRDIPPDRPRHEF